MVQRACILSTIHSRIIHNWSICIALRTPPCNAQALRYIRFRLSWFHPHQLVWALACGCPTHSCHSLSLHPEERELRGSMHVPISTVALKMYFLLFASSWSIHNDRHHALSEPSQLEFRCGPMAQSLHSSEPTWQVALSSFTFLRRRTTEADWERAGGVVGLLRSLCWSCNHRSGVNDPRDKQSRRSHSCC